MLDVKQVSKIYEGNIAYRALTDINLKIDEGEFVGIMGPSGSFLYFRLYMDLDEDKQKFSSIAKMGLTVKELKKVLTRFAPIIVALIHGAVALTALSNLFEFNIFKESVMVLGVFLIIQIIYFFIVRFFYTKQIQAVI